MTAVQLDVQKSGITKSLCDYLVGITYDDIPQDVVESLKIFTLECLGHMLHAHPQPVSRMLVGYARDLGATPQALVVGAGFRTSLAEAAYVNGSLAHADELESYGTIPGSGLIPPIAAALAVGEYRKSSGRAFLAALIAGIEMQGRLGMAGIGACDRGFMGISLVGPGGAGVAAGRLFELSSEQMQNCLGVALPLGNGSLRGCGSMAHVHEAGVPARSGVFAAQLASGGFTSCSDYLDGAHSWGEQYAAGGTRPYLADQLTAGLGDRFFLQVAGVAPKQYGSCGLTHQTIHGTVELMLAHGLQPEDIGSIDLLVPAWADRVAPFRDPVNGEQAKFSIRQGVAGLLVGGVPELPYVHAFSDEASRDPRYVAARERVNVIVEEGASVRGFADQTVVLKLVDGRVLRKVVPSLTAAIPTVDERLEMFGNTVKALSSSQVDQLVHVVMNLEKHDVADVVALVQHDS